MPISIHNKQSNGKSYALNVLNDNIFRLQGDPIEGNPVGKVPTLSFSVVNNKLEFNIFVNNGKPAKEGGMIKFDLDLMSANTFIVFLEDAVRRKEPGHHAMKIMKQAWDRNANKPGEPYCECVLAVGKDKDGLEMIGIQPRKGQPLQFRFVSMNDRPIINLATQEAATPHQISSLVCRGFTNWLKFIVPYLAVGTWDYTKTPEGKWDAKKAAQGGNNGWNNNNNNQGYQGGNQGYQQQQPAPQQAPQESSFEASFGDVPF